MALAIKTPRTKRNNLNPCINTPEEHCKTRRANGRMYEEPWCHGQCMLNSYRYTRLGPEEITIIMTTNGCTEKWIKASIPPSTRISNTICVQTCKQKTKAGPCASETRYWPPSIPNQFEPTSVTNVVKSSEVHQPSASSFGSTTSDRKDQTFQYVLFVMNTPPGSAS